MRLFFGSAASAALCLLLVSVAMEMGCQVNWKAKGTRSPDSSAQGWFNFGAPGSEKLAEALQKFPYPPLTFDASWLSDSREIERLAPAVRSERINVDHKRVRWPLSVPMVHVLSARVVIADYALLKQDFPVLRPLEDAAIDEWIQNHAGIFTSYHATENFADHLKVNTKIPIDERPSESKEIPRGLRPRNYGRAVLQPVFLDPHEGAADGSGWMDIKGVGETAYFRTGEHGQTHVNAPSRKAYSFGTVLAVEALAEFVMEKVVRRTLLTHSTISTLGTYAVPDLGFERIQHGSVVPLRAGLLVRRPNQRGRFDITEMFSAESAFRAHGITSAGGSYAKRAAYVGEPLPCKAEDWDFKYLFADEVLFCDPMNIQSTTRREVVDFGAFQVEDSFRFPVPVLLHNRAMPAERIPVVRPIGQKAWMTLLAQLEESVRQLPRWPEPETDKSNISLEKLKSYNKGVSSARRKIEHHVGGFLSRVDKDMDWCRAAVQPEAGATARHQNGAASLDPCASSSAVPAP